MKGATKRKRVSFALPAHQIDQINEIALNRGLSKSDVVANLLELGLSPSPTPESGRA